MTTTSSAPMKTINLGHRLRYPVTIVKLLKAPGDTVKRQEPLLQYSFKWVKEVGDHIRGDTWAEKQVTVATWDSPVDGELVQWRVRDGETVLGDQPCMAVDEACSHEVQFQGLCALCGRDMTTVSWASETPDTMRAPINMTHDQTSLTVSELQARRAEKDLQRRLTDQRKLSLVVDLDQTIIHACIDPTVGEWQRDPANPNYEAVKHVQSFQLNDDGPRGLATGCWYYIKMRPGLEQFLARVSDLYELHVYTMGTRAYALNIAKIVDPHQRLFGNRVISRDENGSMTAKSLQRLFPVSTSMVVIIDDRADVWPRNRPNLIKVTPYDFFKGIGDINSSFLPRREDLLGPGGPSSNHTNSRSTPAEELASMSGGDDPVLTKRQIEEQERTLEKQITDRPLQHMQEELDREEKEEAEKDTEREAEETQKLGDGEASSDNKESTPSSSSPSSSSSSSPPRHHLLLDDDRELSYLEDHLTRLHQTYYDAYDRNAGKRNAPIPDVGRVLDSLKADALRGTRIALSGLVPIGVDVRRSELGLQVASFGAQLRERITRDVTHLVVSSARPRTQKVRQAARLPHIKIVNQDWLAECLARWTRVDETPYLVDIHPADRVGGAPRDATTDDAEVSDADDTDNQTTRPRPPRLRVISAAGENVALENGANESDADSDDEMDDNDDDLIPPELAEGQVSPVDGLKSFNWGAADRELDEFLASGSEDEDDDSGTSTPGDDDDQSQNDASTLDASPLKRKHGVDDDDDTEAESDSAATVKKQRLLKSKPSSLRAEVPVDDNGSSLPTPQATGDEDQAQDAQQQAAAAAASEDAFDIDEDDLEADLMAEFEAEERQVKALQDTREPDKRS